MSTRYTDEQLDQIEALVRELLQINEDQNAKLIAMNAKLQNEEAKVKQLRAQIMIFMKPYNNDNHNN
jgi:cell division septum initiation protein DivIVA